MALYDNIERLCKERGIKISEMCRGSGASRGSLTDLKMGRIENLHSTTLAKIADYFGVSIDDLYGRSQTVSDADIKFALFGENVTDEMYAEVKAFAEFVKNRKK